MTRADIIHALSLLPERDAIACVVDASRKRREDEARLAAVDDDRRGIVSACATAYGVTEEAIMGQRRLPHVVSARFMAYRLMLDMLGLSCAETGRFFDRHHTTIMHGARCAEDDDSAAAVAAREMVVDCVLGMRLAS